MAEILYFLLSVVLISLSGALMPGPVLAVVIENAPRNRFAGIEAALGHALIELPLVAAIALGFHKLIASPIAQSVVGTLGGIALIFMGIGSFRRITPSAGARANDKPPRSVAAGLIASLNPYFFLWWATAGAAIVARAVSWSWTVVALMFACHIAVDFAWYGSVGFTAARTIRIGSSWQRIAILICGCAMIVFGVYFLRNAARWVF